METLKGFLQARAPFAVSIFLTERCNLDCAHCLIGRPKREKALFDKKDKVMEVLEELSDLKVFMLSFTGGEPTLHKDFTEIVQAAANYDYLVSVTTNGTQITDGLAQKLGKIGLHDICVSLDGSCEQTHNAVRRSSRAFSVAVKAVKNLKKHGLKVTILTTLLQQNYKEVENIVALSERLGADMTLFSPYLPLGPSSPHEKLLLSKEQWLHVFATADKITENTQFKFVIDAHSPFYVLDNFSETTSIKNHYCIAGVTSLAITPDGYVLPCCNFYHAKMFKVPDYNIQTNSIADIWRNGKLFRNIRESFNKSNHKCGTCRYWSLCMGGCRSRALLMGGSYFVPDPLCWEVSDEEN